MRHFCFEHLQAYADGKSPTFPEDVSFLQIADYRDSTYGLYAWEHTDENREYFKPSRPASKKLSTLIYSAYGYPPAIAIARPRIDKLFSEAEPTIDEFEEAYTGVLETLLGDVATSGYFMAAARGKEVGYLQPGCWYWLLGLNESDSLSVYWVSEDYFIYKNPTSDFLLSEQQIESLKQTDFSSQ